jgi:hypothetical protein
MPDVALRPREVEAILAPAIERGEGLRHQLSVIKTPDR